MPAAQPLRHGLHPATAEEGGPAATTTNAGCRPDQQWPTCHAASAGHTQQHTSSNAPMTHAGSTNSLLVAAQVAARSQKQTTQFNPPHHATSFCRCDRRRPQPTDMQAHTIEFLSWRVNGIHTHAVRGHTRSASAEAHTPTRPAPRTLRKHIHAKTSTLLQGQQWRAASSGLKCGPGPVCKRGTRDPRMHSCPSGALTLTAPADMPPKPSKDRTGPGGNHTYGSPVCFAPTLQYAPCENRDASHVKRTLPNTSAHMA